MVELRRPGVLNRSLNMLISISRLDVNDPSHTTGAEKLFVGFDLSEK
jgi:hypothetical protein